MALPAVTSNSPSAGYIAWTASGITFDGDDFPIAAGNTNKKFTWWQYNAGAPTIVSSDSLPTLEPEDILLFLNKNGVGLLVPMTDLTDGSLIVTGSILAPAIAADQIETYHINAGAVTATEIQAGAIGATHIQAGAITTDKLAVGSVSDSLVTNSSFEEFAAGMPLGWTGSVTNGAGSIDIVTGVASSGSNAARLVLGSTTTRCGLTQSLTKAVPVTSNASRKYYIGATIGAGTAITKGLYLRALWYDAAKVYVGISEAITGDRPITTTFARFEGQVTPPSNARYMIVEVVVTAPNVTTNVYVDEVVAYEVTISAQIGDGQITTPKLVANAITANELAAGSVNAKHMVISDFTNLIMDPLLTRPVGESWVRRSGAVAASNIISTAGLPGNAWKLDGVGTEVSVWSDFFEVQGLQEYFVSCKAQQQLTGSSTLGYMRIEWFAKDKVTSAGALWSMTIPLQGWLPVSGMAVAPVDAYYGRVHFIHGVGNTGGSWWVGNPQVRRMNGGELIVDGEITASKIAVGAISAGHIQASAITADKLLVSDRTNYWENPDFEGDTVGGIPKGTTLTNTTLSRIISGGSQSSGRSMEIDARNGSNNDVFSTNIFPVEPGDQFYIRFDYKFLNAVGSASAGVGFRTYGPTKAGITWTLAGPTTGRPTTWTTSPGAIYTVPAGTYFLQPWVVFNNNAETTNRFHVDDIIIRRMNGGELIVDGAITTNKMTANSINGDRILANTLSADKITANSISTDKLAISDFTNYLPGGNFDTSMNMANWVLGTGITQVTTGQYSGTGCLQAAAGAGSRNATPKDPFVAVVPGDKYYLSYWVKTSADYNGTGGNGKLRYGDQTGALIGAITHAATTQTTWAQRSAVITIPAGINGLACSVSFDHTVGTCWIDNLQLRRMHAGELIVDGAIQTNHMTANSINADRLTANTIAAGKLMADSVLANNILAGEIQTNHLAANAITASKLDADAINGKTITGATVQTAATGARVVMDGSGLGAWNTAGTKYLTADSNGLSIDGTITSTGGTNWLGEDVIVKISDSASTSGGRNIAGVSFERENFTPLAFPAVYSDAGTDLMLTSANNEAFLSLANENSGGEAELQGKGINLYSNTGDVNIGKTYNTAGNLNVAKINGRRVPMGLLHLQRNTGTTTITTTNTQINAVTLSVVPGMVLEVSGSYAGGPSGASNQYLSWSWNANGTRFAENSHRSNAAGFGEGDSFSGFYTVPAGQTSVTISLWCLVAAGGGTYVCPADSNAPKLQFAIKDIGDA